MTEPYLDGLRNTSLRPDMKNISLSQDSSLSNEDENENNCSNGTEKNVIFLKIIFKNNLLGVY